MLRSLDALLGYHVKATDGDIGKVYNFFFDDLGWKIRYLVVETGGWLNRRRVLISPVALGQPEWEGRAFPVLLTQDQVRNSPDIDTDKPVSRQQEIQMRLYYAWPSLDGAFAVRPTPPELEDEIAQGDPHLRSFRQVSGYQLATAAGPWGPIEDFLADDHTWQIHQLVVDAPEGAGKKKVLVPANQISSVSWTHRLVSVGLSKEELEQCPVFDPSAPVNVQEEVREYDYLGRLVKKG